MGQNFIPFVSGGRDCSFSTILYSGWAQSQYSRAKFKNKKGIKLQQEKVIVLKISAINESDPTTASLLRRNYSVLFTPFSRFENQVLLSKAMQQNGRSVPNFLQKIVQQKVIKLIKPDHDKKLDKCSDKNFISPMMKYQSTKLALDS